MTASPIEIGLFILVLFGDSVAHFVQWTLYREVLGEQRALRVRLDQVVEDRDEWRSVAQRALLVAQANKE